MNLSFNIIWYLNYDLNSPIRLHSRSFCDTVRHSNKDFVYYVTTCFVILHALLMSDQIIASINFAHLYDNQQSW